MFWIRLFHRLTGAPRHHEDDLLEELTFHQEMKEREFLAQGMSPGAARDAARRALGNVTLAREDARAEWTFSWITDLGRDLRYSIRALAAQPGFTVAAVLALVLGIGVNAILFNIYNALALTPWAVRDAGRVVRLVQQEDGGAWEGFSWPAYRYLRDHTRTFSGITAFNTLPLKITRNGAVWMTEAIAADGNFFETLGTGFAAGRGFSTEASDLRNPAPEVVLHYSEWINHYGGDRGVIGEWIDVNGRRLQVVGVAAEGFSGPVPVSPNLWIPAPWHDVLQPGSANLNNPDVCCAKAFARLRDGATQDRALAEIKTLSAQFNHDLKRTETRLALTAPTLLADPRTKSEATPAFLAVAVASFLILLLACANVANLQLARSAARAREFSVRVSLGASRSRILRQLLAEALVLSLLAAGMTALVSAWVPSAIMRAIASATSATGTLNFTFSNDWRVIGFVMAISLAAALLFGLAPAWAASLSSVSAGMQQGGRSTSHNGLRHALLCAQMILCTVLLSGAALLVRALDRAQHADTGFAVSRMVIINPNLDSSTVIEAQTTEVAAALMDRLGSVPGVVAIAHAVVVPLGRRTDIVTTTIPGTDKPLTFHHNRVSAEFFGTMNIPIVTGRGFTAADEKRVDTVIINEALARRVWPDQNPLGKILMGDRVVIGVARDFHIRELGPSTELAAMIPGQASRESQFLVRLQPGADPASVSTQLAQVGHAVDNRLTMFAAEPYTAIVDRSRQVTVLVAGVASVLSTLALVLACVGIYGVAAYSVAQRIREIGVRMALGAKPHEIVQLVLRENLRVVAIGAALGVAGAYAFGRLLTSMLFGISPGDPRALLSTITILLLTAGAAAWLPARRAAFIDPAITLRHD